MKLKFRAEAKDWLIFIIFCIFLLYVVALAVINLSSMASTGYLYGINPLPAFSPKYITATIVFYLIALGGLFASVSSYFFEIEDGVGFSKERKDKGYSRWAKDKEIKSELKVVEAASETSDVAGIPLICNGKELWVDDGEYHTLVIGSTGAGKTQSTILPTVKVLAKKGESMVITDPKGEIYEKAGKELQSRGYNIILLNFRDPQKGNAWNPLNLPYQLYKQGNQDKAIELLDDLALNILYDESNKNADPFWEKTSADYFSGLALGMFEDANENQININSISLTTTVGEEKFGGSKYVNEYFQGKDPNGAAYINASSTILSPNETRGSIISVFKQKIKLFASRENLSEMLSYSDFTLEEIGEKKTAVFIIIQDEKKTLHPLATIFIKQCYETLIDVAQKHGGKLPVRTNFLLDEFPNMPPLKDVTTMITAARSRQIRFTIIIQNFAQLNQVYGKEIAETIKGNCGNIIYLISTELAALEEISKLCGEVKSKKDDKTASTPLVTVSDLQRMKQFDQIVLRLRCQPYKTHFTPDFKIDWGKSFEKMDYPTREKRSVEVFDIRDFVKERKKQKLFEMMNSNDSKPGELPESTGSSPFDRSLGENPFNRPGLPNMNNNQTEKSNSDFDVDALVRKIDAKIAALEEEEKKEKAKETNKKQVENNDRPTLLNSTFNNAKPKEEIKEEVKMDKVSNEVKESQLERPTILNSTLNKYKENIKPIEPNINTEEEKDIVVDPVVNDNQDNKVTDIDELIRKVDSKIEEGEKVVKPSSIYEGTLDPTDIRIDYSDEEEQTVNKVEQPTVEEKNIIPSSTNNNSLLEEVENLLNNRKQPVKTDDNIIEPKVFEAIDDDKSNTYNLDNSIKTDNIQYRQVDNKKQTTIEPIIEKSTQEEVVNTPKDNNVVINNDIIIEKDSTENDDNFFDDFFDDDDDWS